MEYLLRPGISSTRSWRSIVNWSRSVVHLWSRSSSLLLHLGTKMRRDISRPTGTRGITSSGAVRGKTRILHAHALHAVDKISHDDGCRERMSWLLKGECCVVGVKRWMLG
ncbi:hypothetical protein TWF718_001915 [Orbilia javanica]|uniref:Uncharacterized protein n=1 Tax=Orbilia javanica TaxID=47235 RepID=A0AAN8MVX7_9PEZI